MKITIEIDDRLIDIAKWLIDSFSAYSSTTERIPAENNGSAQETVEEVRAVAEVADAHVEPEQNDQEYDHILSDIQALVSTVEESGLRTRKEIVAMLNAREVKKFTELNITALKEVRDELLSIAATLEDWCNITLCSPLPRHIGGLSAPEA